MPDHVHDWVEVPVLATGGSMRWRCRTCPAWGYKGQNTGGNIRAHQESKRAELQRRYDELHGTGETTEEAL